MKPSQSKLLERAGIFDSPEVDEEIVEIFAVHSRDQLDRMTISRLERFTKTRRIVVDAPLWGEQMKVFGFDPNPGATRVTAQLVTGSVEFVKSSSYGRFEGSSDNGL